ncbi:hypothetical protein PG996_006444 [Apiospora saccharicola]|uniref:Uncharacterized protein n=1 Tax=Apiospora saccharicola TaxID=335842 RepID=A0ABR1VPD5_9PEZI
MSPSSRIPSTISSPAKEMSLGLQRLAETCPEFSHADLLEQLSEKERTLRTNAKSGLKLSWPKASNTRRAVVAKTPPTSNVPPPRGVQSVASRSLPTFGQDPVQLGQMLLRIAGAGGGTSFGVAVQQSLLAFASTHRHGVHTRAAEHKIAALKALADISGCEIGTAEAAQHVAAGMLLCSYEMHHSSCTTGHWLSYLIGIQDIIRATGLDTVRHDPDIAMLLDWAYYYSVLARWSRQHWQRKEFAGVQLAPMRLHSQLLSEMCDGSLTPLPLEESNSKDQPEYKGYLQILDWRIRGLPSTPGCDDFGADSEAKLELYRLAMLIYLNRATESTLNQTSAKTQQQLDRGFSILSQLGLCDQQFPIFILGCEARSDVEREAVLGLIQRTEKHGTSRSFNYASRLLEAFWAQNDLGSFDRRGLGYRDRLSDVISRCRVLPIFV